jgi:hypothetical protein
MELEKEKRRENRAVALRHLPGLARVLSLIGNLERIEN